MKQATKEVQVTPATKEVQATISSNVVYTDPKCIFYECRVQEMYTDEQGNYCLESYNILLSLDDIREKILQDSIKSRITSMILVSETSETLLRGTENFNLEKRNVQITKAERGEVVIEQSH